MQGCCEKVNIEQHVEHIAIDSYTFVAIIVYCKNCGSLKATTHVKENVK
jgi:hypothetical protein